MKKLLLIFLLSLGLIGSANAGWKKILHDSSNGTLYYHKDSMEKSGGYTYIWILTDLVKKRLGAQSYEAYLEVDCGPMKRYRRLSITRYEGKKGKGSQVSSSSNMNAEWEFIPPGNPGYIVFKYAC